MFLFSSVRQFIQTIQATKVNQSQITEIIDYWYSSTIGPFYSKWFDCSIDNEIITRFTTITNKLINNELEDWKVSNNGKLAYLIIADQFSRNIKRNLPHSIKSSICDLKALELSLKMINNRDDLLYPLMAQRMFILLPLRHTKNAMYIRKVLELLEEYKNDFEDDKLKTSYTIYNKLFNTFFSNNISLEFGHCTDVLERFKIATIKNLTELESENIDVLPQNHFTVIENYPDILDLDYAYREKLLDNPPNLLNIVRNHIQNKNYKRLGVSLSGGIDSMVILDIFIKILGKDNVIAMHISHSNRDIAKRELEFIKKWCGDNGITLVYRNVDYMNRESVDRTFYEEETKKIRFNLYKYCMKKYNIEGVALGHHRDDIGENVMMNILHGRDAIDLKGMEKEKTMFNVNIIRPLLDVKKNVVWTYGHSNSIPCFKDSTPDWSWRGVLRRQIYPKLNERVGDIHDILSKLGDKSEEWNTIVQNLIYQPIFNSIQYFPYGCILNLTPEQLKMPFSFYTRILLEVFYKMGTKMITEKNQKGLIEWFKDSDLSKKYQLSNGYKACKTTDGLIYFAKNILFESKWNHTIELNYSNTIRVPFSITDFLNGKMVFTEEYSDEHAIKLVSKFEKGDANRKIYNGFTNIPKFTSGKTINSPNIALITISI